MVSVVFGIPGVGKSSVVKKVVKELSIERIHWGNVAFEIAEAKGIVEDVDKLRKQDLRIQKEIQLESADKIASMIAEDPDKHYVIETHAALKTPQGYLPGLNMEIIAKLKPEVFIVYEAEPGHIYHRRMVDPARDRSDDTTLDAVQLNLDTTRYFAANYAVLAPGTLFVIQNREGDLDYAVNMTIKALEKFVR